MPGADKQEITLPPSRLQEAPSRVLALRSVSPSGTLIECLLGLLPGFWLGSCLGLRVSQPHPDPDPHRSHEPAASRSPSPCSWIRDTYIYAPFPARWRGAANHPNLFLSMNGPVLLGWDNPSSASPACKYFLRESCSNYGSLDRSAIPFFLPQTDHI